MRQLMTAVAISMLLAASPVWAETNEGERRLPPMEQGNVKVLGDAPAMAQGNLNQTPEQAFGGMMAPGTDEDSLAENTIAAQASAAIDQ